MMPATDSITSIPLHQSTLRVPQRVKSAAETWDEFLLDLTDDYLSPALRTELDLRLETDRVVTGVDARKEFNERRKLAGSGTGAERVDRLHRNRSARVLVPPPGYSGGHRWGQSMRLPRYEF
jgi:hypothetical protein